MSLPGTYLKTITACGVTVTGVDEQDGTVGIEPVDTTLAVALAGTLSTRTSDTIGIATSEGHGLAGTETLAIFWTDPDDGKTKCAYGCEITDGTGIGEDTIGFTASAGDALPVEDTAITIATESELDVTFDGDNLILIGVSSTRTSHFRFLDSEDNVLAAVTLPVATGRASNAWGWSFDTGFTNPLTGNAVASLVASDGSSTGTANLKMTGLQY